MRVGIIGSGGVGRALAIGFVGRGDEVMIGSRSPDGAELTDWRQGEGQGVAAGTFAEVAAHGELVLLATKGEAREAALDLAGHRNLSGKVLIDVTNPLDFGGEGPPGLSVGGTDSGGEQVQRWLSEARVVKAFNIVNAADMVGPEFPDGPPDMMIAGDDDAAKADVISILNDFGWPTVYDLGGIERSRELESLVILWVVLGVRRGSWGHAFKVLTRD